MSGAFRILERKRAGARLTEGEIRDVVRGASDGSWSEAQLAAFLMAVAVRGLDDEETGHLTLAVLESGEQWGLAADVPLLTDKHSTGGVGDKVSLILAPLLASCDVPVVMLTGRALGHTGGTADKLESIPGLSLELDRRGCLDALCRVGVAIGIATSGVAPADKRLYAIRDQTATVDSIPLITASIVSKKLAAGAAALVYDVKTGEGAFLPEIERSRDLAERLVAASRALDREASALITDMSQPLGRWVGHSSEILETFECLSGRGPDDLMEVTFALCEEVSRLAGTPRSREQLAEAIDSGRARERFERWAEHQGADSEWLRSPDFPLAPKEHVFEAPRAGKLARVANRQLGLLLIDAGGGRRHAGDEIDDGIALEVKVRIGDEIEEGDELGRLYLRTADPARAEAFRDCFEIADEGEAPVLIPEVIGC